MKISTATALVLFAASASAFAAVHQCGSKCSTSLSMSPTTRSDFIKTAAATAGLAFLPQSVSAAKYGGFGAGSPEVINPKDAVVDQDVLKSEPVQKSISGVRGYLAAVRSIRDVINSDPQAEIAPQIRREFDFPKLRADLNNLNAALDEDTQRGTDRIIRIIMQDITELETASRQKKGVVRSERRLTTIKGKLDKLEKAFQDYLAFV